MANQAPSIQRGAAAGCWQALSKHQKASVRKAARNGSGATRWQKMNVPAMVARIVAAAAPKALPPMRCPTRKVPANHSSEKSALGSRAANAFTPKTRIDAMSSQ